MTDNAKIKTIHTPRVLLFSHRNIYEPEVWRCSFFEFEQILQQIDSVDLLSPKPTKFYNNGKRLALRIGKRFDFPVNPGIPKIKIERDYDIFFTVCEKPSELLHITAVEGWKENCKISICWLPEFYVNDMPQLKSCLKVLKQFDYVIFMFDKNKPFQDAIPGQGFYLPAGIDAALFCPYPNPPKRFIDVLSIGRRSDTTHQVLLQMARQNKIFYVYDTINDLHAYSVDQHRFLFANMAKRSRYFFVNPGKIDRPDCTGGQSEFGYRYFEGSAPGSIMIGDIPHNKEFNKIFGHTDAMIYLPFGSDNIDTIINDFDNQPDRQERMRKNNIRQSLLYHDWVYRWETILQKTGFSPLPALYERKKDLARLAKIVEQA